MPVKDGAAKMAATINKSGPSNALGTLHTVALNGAKTAIVNILQCDAATIVFELSNDDTATWVPAYNVYRLKSNVLWGRTGFGQTARGRYVVDAQDIHKNWTHIRARIASYTSGYADAEIEATQTAAAVFMSPQNPIRNVIAFLGDSITENGQNQIGTTNIIHNAGGYSSWVPPLVKQRYKSDFSLNFGIAGQNSLQINARVQDVINARPRWAVVLMGTNDFTPFAGNADASCAVIRDTWTQLLDAGIKVVAVTILPKDISSPTHDFYIRQNQFIRAHIGYRPNFYVADPAQDLVDPASSTGAAKTNYYIDTTHPAAGYGSYAVAKAVAGVINAVEPLGNLITQDALPDAYSTTLPTGNLLLNGAMQGVGGTLSGGTTGTVATSWTGNISNAAGLAMAGASVVSGGRTWQQMTGSGTVTANTTALAILSQTVASPATKVFAGDLLEFTGELEVDAGAGNIISIAAQCRTIIGGVTRAYMDLGVNSNGAVAAPNEAMVMTMRAPLVPIYDGSVTQLDVQFKVFIQNVTAATPFVFRATNLALRKII
jgi:hypothetical protein